MTAPVFPPNVSHPFRKIVSHIRSAIRGALVQIARCVYVSQTRGNNAIIQVLHKVILVLRIGTSGL